MTEEGKQINVKVDDYLASKKMSIQFGMVPKIMLPYVMEAVVMFFHIVMVLNNSVHADKEDLKIPHSLRTTNWLIISISVYIGYHSGKSFCGDFYLMLDNKKVNEEENLAYQMKVF